MPSKNIYKNNTKMKSTRDGFGEALLYLGAKNKSVVVVSADLAESTRVDKFAKKFPQRFFEVGVAEQNMMGVGAGLALAGKIPYVASFGVFSPGRNWDQIRVSVCYSKTNVKIIASHTGLSVGPDGASHQALEDIALMRVLPNMTVIAPADYQEAKKATIEAAKINGPVYIRLTRQESANITTNNSSFKVGQANILKIGQDLTIIGCGPILEQALLVAGDLAKKNISVEIINCHTIKPLDSTTILRSVKKTKHLISIEDHQRAGGLGSAIAEMLAENYPLPMKIIGVKDSFGESGTADELWGKYGLSRANIVSTALKLLKK